MVTRKLGRGLDSLIEEREPVGPAEPVGVECARIRPNPFQPREALDDETVGELAASIREHGVLQPVVVRRSDGGYELVAGERRWRACLRLGLERIPAVVRDVPDDRMLEIALVENLQREDLNPIEKARAYRRYVTELGLTHEAAAARLGKNRSTITNQIRLLDLPDDIQEMVSRGTISMGHARALLAAPDDETRRALARRIEQEGLSVRQTEELARPRPAPPVERAEQVRSAYFEELERRLRERYATKARIVGGRDRGRVTLDYDSAEELGHLLDLRLPGD